MLIAIAVCFLVAMAAYDLPAIIRCREWGELGLYLVLWVAALVLSILQILGIGVPNPTTLITELVSPLGEAISRALGLS